MNLASIKNSDKRRLFEFIAHLAILAGREMSKDGFAEYNEVVWLFLNNAGLMDDFKTNAEKANLPTGHIPGRA
jgi:hypothetical protein